MERNGGRLLVDCLLGLGASKCFGVPGESYLPVLDALHDTNGRLDFIMCRQEGGASFMAAAYGKLTGNPGICMVTRGPGATNASIGVHSAFQDSSPMIVFVGQVSTEMRGREAFQELDYRDVFGGMAKWVVEIDHVDRIPEILHRAWKTAIFGRPGPVVVALPEDMLRSTTRANALGPLPEFFAPEPAAKAVQQACDVLRQAKRPLIMFAGSNWRTEGKEALQSFAERSDIPVVSVFRYLDQFDNHSPVFCGEVGVGMASSVRTMVAETDVLLAINCRFGENSTDGYTLLDVPVPNQRLIHVHASDLELGKIFCPEIGIVAGPNEFAIALSQESVSGDWGDWREAGRDAFVAGMKLPKQPSPVDMGKVAAYLRTRLPEDVILTHGAGNFTVWPDKFFLYGKRARLLGPQSGAMGYGIPAAVAAKVAQPERTVVCFAGDGDFQMTSQELATASQNDAQPIILIVNNGMYGTIRAHQERNYPDRISGTTIQNPDFVSLAKAYGFYAERVEVTEDFAEAFERALSSTKGAVLDLNVSAEALTPRQSLSAIRQAAKDKMQPS